MLRLVFIFIFLSIGGLYAEEESTFKETEKAFQNIKNSAAEVKVKAQLEVEALGKEVKVDSAKKTYKKEAVPVLDSVNKRVVPSKNNQKLPRVYGDLPSYGLSGLFYTPKMRSAQILNPQQWSFQIGLNYSQIDMTSSSASYINSEIDLDLKQIPLSFSYGFEWSELQVTAGISELSGTMDLATNRFNNVIHYVDPAYEVDDIQVDYFIDLETLLWRSVQADIDVNKKGDHVLSVGVKLPVGAKNKYLSSGGFDFSIGSYNSYSFEIGERKIDWDVAAQLILVQSVDTALFKDEFDSKHFLAIQNMFSTQIKNEVNGFVGLGYRSKSLDGPFDEFQNDGFEYFIGFNHEMRKEKFLLSPKVKLSGLEENRFALQAGLTISY